MLQTERREARRRQDLVDGVDGGGVAVVVAVVVTVVMAWLSRGVILSSRRR